MTRLDKAAQKLLTLGSIRGKNAKQAYILVNATDEDFLGLLKARLDPYMTYKMTKINKPTGIYTEEISYENTIKLLQSLNDNNINDTVRESVANEINTLPKETGIVLGGIITKSLPLGVDTSVNKALGYKLIPTFNVMLATALKEGLEPPIPCQVDIKYDGVRSPVVIQNNICTMYTRKGRVMHFPLLEEEFLRLADGEDLMFDCELETEMRTGISGICNSNMKTGYKEGSDEHIVASVFDVLPTEVFLNEGISNIQSQRTLELQQRFANHNAKRVVLAESQTVYSMDKLQELSKHFIDIGLEGIIAKDPNAVYSFKRSRAWIKLKAINSTTMKVVGVTVGKKKRLGKIGALMCESSDGKIVVNVGSGLNDVDLDMYTEKPPIGMYVEVLFNVLIKGRDSDVYSLFLPRYKYLRIDKTEADSLEKVLSEHIGEIQISSF